MCYLRLIRNTHPLKKILKITGLCLLLIIIGLFASAEIFEEKIGGAFRQSINASLKSEFQFKAFDLSMVRGFPSASIRFQDVYLLDTKGDTLIQADRANFNLNVFSLLRSKIQVSSTEIESGQINLSIDKKGNGNYEILSDSLSDEGSTNLAINEAIIKDIDINYKSAQAASNVQLYAEDLLLQLDLAEVVKVGLLGQVKSKVITIDKLQYLINQNLSLNSGISYDLEDQSLEIENGEIGVDGILVRADGTIDYNDDHEMYDLVLTNTDGNLESIFQLLPKDTVEEFKKITSSGDFNLTVFYKGKQSKYSTPALQADLSYARGRIVIPQFEIPLKNVSFSAKYLDKSKKGLKDASIHINGFKASLDGERISGNMAYDNFSNPHLKLSAKGKMPIQTVLDITGIQADKMDGNLEFNELEINGLIRDLSSPLNQTGTISKADVDLDNISFEVDGKEILMQNGRLAGEGDYFELHALQVRTPKSVFELDGHLKRLVPFMFAEFQRPDLQFNLDVKSVTCDVKEILELSNSQSMTNTSQTSPSDGYLSAMNGDLSISIDRFTHEDIKGTDFKGHLSFINGNVGLKGSSRGMQGDFELEGMINNKDHLEAKLVCNNIDVNEFFEQCHDFGQETLRAKHLKGKLNAQLLINGDWKKDGSFDTDRMHTYGRMHISDGALIDFKLMNNFSSYIKTEDLEHIKFASLDNYFEIKNRVIHIPAMFVQSNAANLTVSGEHAFNNAIKYNIKVNAAQVLKNKLKKHNPRLSPVPARKKGFFNLYYAVKGTVDQPTYKTAKRQVKSDFVSSEYHKSAIKKHLDRAFPQQKNFEINTSPTDVEDKDLKFIESDEDEFLDEISSTQKG